MTSYNIIRGTSGDDLITGTDSLITPDKIFGGYGDDTIYGGAGDDWIYSGRSELSWDKAINYGNDLLNGGAGNDTSSAPRAEIR